MFTIRRHGNTRFWAVFEGPTHTLIAITVYKKGAREVVRRIIEGK
jgi:hypothetical protein